MVSLLSIDKFGRLHCKSGRMRFEFGLLAVKFGLQIFQADFLFVQPILRPKIILPQQWFMLRNPLSKSPTNVLGLIDVPKDQHICSLTACRRDCLETVSTKSANLQPPRMKPMSVTAITALRERLPNTSPQAYTNVITSIGKIKEILDGLSVLCH